jgi:hypothetical protein
MQILKSMRKLLVIFVLVSAWFLAAAQQKEVRSIGGFTGVKAGEAIDVYLKKGDKESVMIEVTGARTSDVLTEVSGSYLKIHMKSGDYRNRNVKAYVTYVKLDRISASSASNIFSDGTISGGNMDISASSAASVEVSLLADAVEVDVSSAGDVVLEGKAKSLKVEVSSAGELDAYNLESEQVDINASSAGSAKVTATRQINANASSGGVIRYRGSPTRTNSNSSSGGSVKKVN